MPCFNGLCHTCLNISLGLRFLLEWNLPIQANLVCLVDKNNCLLKAYHFLRFLQLLHNYFQLVFQGLILKYFLKVFHFLLNFNILIILVKFIFLINHFFFIYLRKNFKKNIYPNNFHSNFFLNNFGYLLINHFFIYWGLIKSKN